MSAEILIVEDDENLRVALCDNLEHEGHRVHVARTGAEAHAALAKQGFSLIILDIMLPDTDGYAVCRELRARGDTTMVLMLTARTLEDDLVRGFDAGADDYLKKPYRLRELLSRVGALLRRSGAQPSDPRPRVAGFTLDLDARVLLDAQDEPVSLTKTEFDLLALFLRREGSALSRDLILDQVWGETLHVDTRTVDNFVSSLKKKMGWSPQSPFAIETVRGYGYRFVLNQDE
jgi:DNA-binding response OmpR family regulator